MKRRGFTLIEMLVVVALTSILLGIIMVPMIQGFNITRAASALGHAQRVANGVQNRVFTELSSAAAVRPTSGNGGNILIVLPDDSNVPVPMILPNAKIDFFPAAKGSPSAFTNPGEFVNPDTGRIDPTANAPLGQPNFPAAPGSTLVRYFIGLRDPELPYLNPYVKYETSTGARYLIGDAEDRDNLYVLYRAEVTPYRFADTDSNPATPNVKVANDEFFAVDPVTLEPILDDPSFFTPLPGDSAAQIARRTAWASRAVPITPESRFDMISFEVDLRTDRLVAFNGMPRVTPLARFQPALVTDEAATANTAVAAGLETGNAAKVGPIMLETEKHALDARSIRIQPSLYNPGTGWGPLSGGAVQQPWTIGDPYLDSLRDPAFGLIQTGSDGTSLFAPDLFAGMKADGTPYPFNQSITAAASLAPWDELFIPVRLDPKSGNLTSSFDIRDVGAIGGTNPDFQYRVPTSAALAAAGQTGIHTGPAIPFNVDPSSGDWGGFDFSDADGNIDVGINRRFNWLYHMGATFAPGQPRSSYALRFVDLRVPTQPGGIPSPLDRRTPATGGSGFKRSQIVPGSEVIIGPDQRPGVNYGQFVRYERTTQRPVGPNQYLINYVDQVEPDWALLGFTGGSYDKALYDPNDFLSAVMQARYRAGYVEFNSAAGEPIPDHWDPTPNAPGSGDEVPTGNIFITYDFQFSEPNDAFFVDYDSASLLEVILTIRTFPSSGIKTPQGLTLTSTTSVKNYLR